jgi:hypothetical protein
MDITPTPAFTQAIRQVLGIADLIPGPEIVIPAMRDDIVGSKIRTALAAINGSRAGRIADEQAAEMKWKLAGGISPAALSYDNIKTEAEMVAAEWICWFEEERRIYATGP